MNKIVCSKCGKKFDKKLRTGTVNYCPRCYGLYHYQKRIRNRDKVLNNYGNKCVICGETNKDYLTVDHINGGGRKNRH